MLTKTPLDPWIYSKISGRVGMAGRLTRMMIESYQLHQLKATLALAAEKSPFYRRLLAGLALDKIGSLKDLRNIPFTTAADIKANSMGMLCVSQSEINRVVTLSSTGTTGRPKRVFFTTTDQELTRDFFRCGMSTLVQPGDRVLILLPGEVPGSVGHLLAEGLQRMGVHAVPHGIVQDARKTLEVMEREGINALVGIPTQVLALARFGPPGQNNYGLNVKNMLLSTDNLPRAIIAAIEKAWKCRVYNHYGMTEMGLGGGIECRARTGLHLREADLYFEIINPDSGENLPDGEEGELVFTTLTRQGMPLIRYRTGDLASFIPGPCPCGTVLKRLTRVRDRIRGRVPLGGGGYLSMSMLDEALFAVDGVINFKAAIGAALGPDRLSIEVQLAHWAGREVLDLISKSILSISVIVKNVHQGYLTLAPIQVDRSAALWPPAKRYIQAGDGCVPRTHF